MIINLTNYASYFFLQYKFYKTPNFKIKKFRLDN
jgi:hypothetical protein